MRKETLQAAQPHHASSLEMQRRRNYRAGAVETGQSLPPRQIDLLNALAEKMKAEKLTKAKALATLQRAGILNSEGKFTEPYSCLAEIVVKK